MKIICIGRNYSQHALELKNDIPTEPVIFMKPQTALLKNNDDFYIPNFTTDCHYECELVLKICKNGKHIQQAFAHQYYDAFSLGIDFTARDIQDKQKAKSLPWEIAKAFDNSAVIGEFIPFTPEIDKANMSFSLYKNNIQVQLGNTQDLIFNFDFLITYISQYFTLQQGDLIYTGTPQGVGPVGIGDILEAKYMEQTLLTCAIK